VAKKLKLEEQNSADFRGLGIVSAEKDYRLCFFLNNELGLDFDKSVNIACFDPVKKKRTQVSCHIHQDLESGQELYLVKNRQESFFVVPEMKQADYLFLEPANQPDSLKKIKNAISNVVYIQGCFIIPDQNLKHIDAE